MTREQFAIGCVILAATGLGCFLIGLWWGGRRSAEDIAALEADLEEALRRHPAGKRRQPGAAHDPRPASMLEPFTFNDDGIDEKRMLAAGMIWDGQQQDWVPDPVAWYGPGAGRHVPGFDAPTLEPTQVIPPPESDTAWSRRMGLELEAWTAAKLAETDEWLREMTR